MRKTYHPPAYGDIEDQRRAFVVSKVIQNSMSHDRVSPVEF